MAVFSSTQPSLRARVLPRFPAQVLAGNGITITKGNGIYTFEVINDTAGDNSEVQFNDNGVPGGDPTFTFDKTTDTLSLAALDVSGNIDVGGVVLIAGYVQVGVTTVGLLPTVGTAGRRLFVSDSVATTFASIVSSGGTAVVPVYDDGTNWRIG